MLLYHGSAHIIEKPAYGKGKKNNDYGRGFYCTEHEEMAKEWAVDEHLDGYVNRYRLEESGLNILHLGSHEYCVLHWITLLLQNRQFDLETPLAREAYRYLCEHFSVDLQGVDVIVGYRADDSFFSFASDFVEGIISVSQLSAALKLGELGEQVFLRSRRAFAALEYLGSEPVSAEEWYRRKAERDTKARAAYHTINKEAYIPGELYMIRILDEEVKPDDPRLQ
jgi:hypothetical protein